MAFWNRKDKSKDPLLKIILDKYHLNLLSIPRENATVCGAEPLAWSFLNDGTI